MESKFEFVGCKDNDYIYEICFNKNNFKISPYKNEEFNKFVTMCCKNESLIKMLINENIYESILGCIVLPYKFPLLFRGQRKPHGLLLYYGYPKMNKKWNILAICKLRQMPVYIVNCHSLMDAVMFVLFSFLCLSVFCIFSLNF